MSVSVSLSTATLLNIEANADATTISGLLGPALLVLGERFARRGKLLSTPIITLSFWDQTYVEDLWL